VTADNKRKYQLEVGLDATGVKRGAQEVSDAAGKMSRDVQQAGATAGKSFDGIGEGAEQASQKADRATKRLIDSIQRTTAAAEAGGRSTAAYYEQLATQRGLNGDALRPYIDRLRQVERAQGDTGKAMAGTAVSAAQMQAALRGVPAQFTDIATSLASGQQPLTVFLQQGGQLKDMFGGIGPAARALGGYVAGLINPLTLAAAGAGALFLAFQAGSSEISKLNQAVILSGERLGVTAESLQNIAAGIAAVNQNTTQGRAAEVLTQLATQAKVAAGDLDRFAQAALAMERAGGPAAQEAVKAFAELGKEPVKAALELTRQYNFLTEGTYRQIKALEDQGRATEAAALAQRSYADFLEQRAPRMEAALGLIERAWRAVREEAARALDDFKGIGRNSTAEDQLIRIRAQISELQRAGQSRYVFGPTLAELRQQEANLQETLRLQQRSADAAKQRADATQASASFDREADKYLSKRVQMEREIAQVRRLGAEAGRAPAEVARLEAEIRGKYAARTARAIVDPLDAEAMRAYAKGLDDFQRLSLSAAAGAEQLSKSQAKLREIQAAPTWAEYSRQQQEQLIYAASLSQAEEDRAAALKEGARIAGEAAREHSRMLDELRRGSQRAEQQAQALRDEAEAQALVIPGYRSLETAIVLVEIARLRERQAAMLGNEDAVLAIQREIDARQKLVEMMGQRDMRRASEEQAKKAAEDWKRTSDSIRDSLTDALMRGFEGGKGFARNLRDTVVNMFRTMVLRPIVQAIVNPVALAISGPLAMPSGAQAAGNVLGQAGGLGNVAQSLGSMYQSITGAFQSIGTNVSLAADNIGSWLVNNTTGALNQAGGTLMQNALQVGQFAQAGAGAFAGFGIGKAISGQYSVGGSSSNAPAIGSLIGTFIGGPLGGVIGGAIGGVVNRAFGRGPKTAYESGIEGSFSGGDAAGDAYSMWVKKGGWFRSNKYGTDRSAMDKDVAQALDAGAVAVFEQTKAWASALQLPADRLGELTSSFKVKFTDDAEANKQAIADVIKAYGETLASAYGDLLRPLQKTGETLSDTLGRVSVLQSFSENLNQLGGVFSRVANLGIDVRESFIEMAGGMDALMANAMGFAQNYYTREEIAGLKAGEIQRALLDAGVAGAAGLTGRESFRALVEGTDVGTEAGRQQLAALLSVQGAFVDVADYLAETGATLAQAAQQAPQTGALASLISPMQAQTDATLSLSSGMAALRATIDRMIDTLKQGGISGGAAAGSATPAPAFAAWPGEVYIDPNGGA